MPYEMSWYQEQRILYAHISGHLTLEEIEGINRDVLQGFDEGQAPVHFVINLSEITKFPTNMLSIKNRVAFMSDPRLGWFILIGDNSLIRSFGTIIAQLTRARFRMFKTEQAALAFLAAQDSTLRDS